MTVHVEWAKDEEYARHLRYDPNGHRRVKWLGFVKDDPTFPTPFSTMHRFVAYRPYGKREWTFLDEWTDTRYSASYLKDIKHTAGLIVQYEDPWLRDEDGWRSLSGRFYASNAPRDGEFAGLPYTYLRDFKTGRLHRVECKPHKVRHMAIEILNLEARKEGHHICMDGGFQAVWLRHAYTHASRVPALRVIKGGVA